MTAPTPPSGTPGPTPEETEVVNAYVDGEATPEEVAQVEGDTELRAAADRVRSLRATLEEQPPTGPDEDVRETHIAAALSEFGSAPAPVSDLSAHRERKAWYQRVPLSAVAAAAVIVLVAVVAGIAQLDSDEGTDTASVADEDVSAADEDTTFGAGDVESGDLSQGDDAAEAESDGAGGATDGPPTTMSTLAAPHPSYETVDDFVEALDSMPRTTAGAATGQDTDEQTDSGQALGRSDEPDPLDNCPDVRDRYIRNFDDVLFVTAMVDGRDMVGILYDDDGEQRRAVYDVSDAGCEFVVER